MSTRFLRGLALSVVIAVGLSSVVVPQSASAKQAQQLSTCLNLATGANRVLVRGACDSVLEMTQVWDQVAADEPVGKFFSARTLALAVLLNTGGDVSKFTKKDWVSLARLQAANQAMIDGATISSATRAKEVSVQEVRAMVTTCVANATGASRVLVSGQCQKRSETQRVWESLDPPQKPLINDGTPDIPQIEGVTVVGPTSRAVTFKPPVMVGSSPIRSITVIAIPGGQWVTISGGTGGTALFTGLSPDITYTFLAVAVNDSGAGPRVPSQRTGSRPEPSFTPDPTPAPSPSPSVGTGTGGGSPVTLTAPSAPTSVVATAGSTQVSVAFTAPSSTGGASITSYSVTSSPGGFTASGSSSPIVVTGLANGTAYTFTVTATNSVGPSVASVASSSVTPKLAQSITFANPVTQNFGTTPTLSAISDSSLTVAFTSSTSSVCTISSGGLLAFVTVGTCTINADQVGDGSYSAATRVSRSFTVSAVAPGAPTIGTATASSGQTSVAFTAPASTGGASITSYTVTSSSGGPTASGSSSPIVVTGLTNGTAYTFTVTATNSAGTGSASGASGSVTGLGSQSITFDEPGTKSFGTTPTLTATSSSSLTVSFTSSTSGVCTITTGGLLAFVTVGTCTINADQVGNGSYSAATTVTRSFTVAAAEPGAPTSVVATSGVTQASVVFTAPASTGGASITSYTVTSSPGGFTSSGSSSPIVVTGLTNGTAYTFTVTAANSVGTGSASVASSGVTPKFAQTITFTNPGEQSFGTTPTLTATSSSALTVSFTSSTSGVCTITSGGVLAFVAAGTCTINADQAGDSSNFAATQVTQSFTVTRTYAVGETGPGGGKVFYVASTSFACGPDLLSSCKYLEANPSSIINIWCASGPMSNTVTSPVFSSAIGGGYSNTQRMVAGCDSGLAYAARATNVNGLTDWYVPNKAEWNAMWAARANLPGYFDSSRAYMASEESSASQIPKINGATGAWGDYHKTVLHTSIYSRAIRAF
jgi:hypothetical protein